MFFFFFFQAEDGIRDATVTGVQTCALPICLRGEVGLQSNPGEGVVDLTAVPDGAPHPDPLPAGGEREKKPGGDGAASGDASTKPLLLVEKLVKEYPRQGATATLGKLFGRK